MATLQASGFLSSSLNSASRLCKRGTTMVILDLPKSSTRSHTIPLPDLQIRRILTDELGLISSGFSSLTTTQLLDEKRAINYNFNIRDGESDSSLAMAKLFTISEAVADRVEMHKNIGKQRENWNSLLLTSINGITLTASLMSGIAATSGAVGAPLAALKLSSTLMFLGATGMLLIMNKIQPSQLVEEQRNATRLFQRLHSQIQTMISIGNLTERDVKEAMDRVLALDKAYPLPLLGVMLEKFPSKVEPAVWWPQQQQILEGNNQNVHKTDQSCTGWDMRLEKEMRSVVEVLKRKDEAEYMRLGGKALKLNKLLAVSGPLFTGIAAIGSAFVGSSSWAAMLGVVGGALASVVNTLEHAGQVGMVFEMYRSNAGFFKLMEESIESNMINRRENGELFGMKVALQLGRSLSELRNLASSSSSSIKGDDVDEFGSKLFLNFDI